MASKKSDVLIKGLIAVLGVALLAVVADAMRQRIVQAGDEAPGFKITADNGKVVTPTDFGGRLLVLNFWATWCAPCIEEIPSLEAFQAKFKDQGVVVLAVSIDKNEKSYKRFLERAGVSFLTSRDPEADVNTQYGTFKVPETYIINSKGEVVEKFIGPENWMNPEVLQRVQKLL